MSVEESRETAGAPQEAHAAGEVRAAPARDARRHVRLFGLHGWLILALVFVLLVLGGSTLWILQRPDDRRIVLVCLDERAEDDRERFAFSLDAPSGPWIPLPPECRTLSTGQVLSQAAFGAVSQVPAAKPYLHSSTLPQPHVVPRLPDRPTIYCRDTSADARPCPPSRIASGCDRVSERDEIDLCVIPRETCCR
jgi:hypothetical protein